MRICPGCHGQLTDQETTCQLCGSYVGSASSGPSAKGKMPGWGIVLGSFGTLFMVASIGLMVYLGVIIMSAANNPTYGNSGNTGSVNTVPWGNSGSGNTGNSGSGNTGNSGMGAPVASPSRLVLAAVLEPVSTTSLLR